MSTAQIIIGEAFLVVWRAFFIMLAWGILSNYLDIGTIGFGGAVVLVLAAESISNIITGKDTITAEKRMREVRDE